MKQLNFDSQFAHAIMECQKCASVRRDTFLELGDVVELVALLPRAGSVEYAPLKIVCIDAIYQLSMQCEERRVWINGEALKESEIEKFMHDNGWNSAQEGFSYYKSMFGKSFDGVNISWI